MGAKDGLTWLTRLAIREPSEIDKLVWALQVGGQEIVGFAMEVARESGYPAAQALSTFALQRDDPGLDSLIWGFSDDGSNVLSPLLADVGLRKLSRGIDIEPESEELYKLRQRCIINLKMCGRPKEALPLSEMNIEWLRSAISASPQRELSIDLASDLLGLKTSFLSDGRWNDAQRVLREALAIGTDLYQRDPGDKRTKLLHYNCNLQMATELTQLRDPQARDYFSKTIALGRALDFEYPGKYRSLLAASLSYYSGIIADDQPKEAASFAREAVDIYADLADSDSDRWSHRLATALRDGSLAIFKSGATGEALANLDRAERIFRALRQGNEDSYRHHHADTLRIKAQIFEKLGKSDDQIDVILEALKILKASEQCSFTSAKLFTLLALVMNQVGDRSVVYARGALLHILSYSSSSDNPDRGVLLASVPYLAHLADPGQATSLVRSARELSEGMRLSAIDTGEEANLEHQLTDAVIQTGSRINQLIASCCRDLDILGCQEGDGDLRN